MASQEFEKRLHVFADNLAYAESFMAQHTSVQVRHSWSCLGCTAAVRENALTPRSARSLVPMSSPT